QSYEEGRRMPPAKSVECGEIVQDVLSLRLYSVRTPEEREGDLLSQIGACRVGEARLREVMAKYDDAVLAALICELLDYSERLVRAELAQMPAGTFEAEDFLDDDGLSETPVPIRV